MCSARPDQFSTQARVHYIMFKLSGILQAADLLSGQPRKLHDLRDRHAAALHLLSDGKLGHTTAFGYGFFRRTATNEVGTV